MKHLYKIGLLLLLLGLALFISGWQGSGHNISAINGSLGSFTLHAGSSDALEDHSADYSPTDLKQIVLDEDIAEVHILPSSDDSIHLRWQEREGNRLNVDLSGKTLIIKRENQGHFGVYLNMTEAFVTELELPASLTLELKVQTDTGSITAETLDLNGSAQFSTDTGALSLTGLSLSALDVESDTGRIVLGGSCGAVTVDGGTGSVTAEGLTCASLDIKTDTGAIRLTDVSAAAAISAKSDTGAITLSHVSGGSELSFKTDTGSIRGSLTGKTEDYTFRTKSGTGRSNLPGNWGHGALLLTVSSDTGTIEISFEDD